ncbi:MAG TPA: hypothetical protein EYP21_04015 [Syntrophaceae bacterium]|nr:hypothetical protein [Syntrophaceae bacterium]
MKRLIIFDLEGPLSPMDHASSSMGLIEGGEKIFAVISRYDDLLTLEGKEGYEPGDTLSLIIPFLLSYGITEEDLREVSHQAPMVQGAKELVTILRQDGWQVYIASTSYEQHALNIGREVGVSEENIFCTPLKLSQFHELGNEEDFSFIRTRGQYILENLYSHNLNKGVKDKLIRPYLDRFFWHDLPQTALGQVLKQIRVMGGRRKVRAVEAVLRKNDAYLNEVVVVGDSITDFQMLRAVEAAGGLAIVFNGNQYALPHGTVGLATSNIKDLLFILKEWLDGGREKIRLALDRMLEPQSDRGPFYHWLAGKRSDELDNILNIHKKMRTLVRGEAAAMLG